MPVHDGAVHGHLIQFGGLDLNPFALLLKKNPYVSVT